MTEDGGGDIYDSIRVSVKSSRQRNQLNNWLEAWASCLLIVKLLNISATYKYIWRRI